MADPGLFFWIMKNFILLLLFISITSFLFSQSFYKNKDGEECTLEIKNFLVDPEVSYSFDVYITRNSSNWSTLGHLVFFTEIYYSDMVFSYNSSALVNPVVTNLSQIVTGSVIYNSIADVLSVNLLDGGSEVPMNETLLLTITFDTVAPDATAQLSWRFGDTTIIDENSNHFSYADGTLLLLGSDNSSLPVSQGANNETFDFMRISPNPLGSGSSSTQLYITAPSQGHMELNVFNIKGQLINTLYNNAVQKNQDIHLSWDGKDSHGNDLSSGIYLYQLLIENRLYETKKVVIIR